MTPENKKILNYVLIALGIGGVGYIIFSSSDNGGDGGGEPTGNAGGNAGSSGSTFNAKNIADDLLEAMRESGTDEDTIIGLLRYVSSAQFDAVFFAFGKQQYNATLGNQINPLAWISELPFVDLKGWLKSELSEQEYLNLKRKYPSKL